MDFLAIFKGVELQRLPVSHTCWQNWQQLHPDTLVLSTDTGFRIDYRKTAYQNYDRIRQLYFPVANTIPEGHHPKEQVLGVEINGESKAFHFSELEKQGKARFTDQLASSSFEVIWNEPARSAKAIDTNGEELVTITAFWFASRPAGSGMQCGVGKSGFLVCLIMRASMRTPHLLRLFQQAIWPCTSLAKA
ncbi:MAG: hypothetical protein ACI9H8_001718 [Lysobacterales bacterium]|jgi:hypothetical protein